MTSTGTLHLSIISTLSFRCSLNCKHKALLWRKILTVWKFFNLYYCYYFVSSTAYSQETACLNAHVDSCVQGNYLNIFRDSISKLLLLLVYHCGDLGYQVSDINSLLLESSDVQCNANELTNIVTCWDDFRVTFQANRSDPALCRYTNCIADCREGGRTQQRHSCHFSFPFWLLRSSVLRTCISLILAESRSDSLDSTIQSKTKQNKSQP